ncbi:MARVEL domain-containing protein sing isoform X2 [Oratosquilla oratoria]|uniref:MARVEL domain-containing protein sing isoform X2 n=1 Tax=Oratosquilla oratoria TaxID=337810 RepID=UPI003F75AA79
MIFFFYEGALRLSLMRQGPSVGWTPGAPPMIQTQPTVVMQPAQYGGSINSGGGIQCCCCTICSCVHLGFLKTQPGWLKVVELVLSALCQTLLLNYGVAYANTIGSSFHTFLTTCSACLFIIALLIFSYIISAHSFNLIRSSVLETVFNWAASILYLLSSSHLTYAVQTKLWIQYLTQPQYAVYPAMTACYVLGFVLGCIHAIDGWLAYKHLHGRR